MQNGANKMKIEWVQECESCRGSGVYIGMTEREGAVVICSRCRGTGRQKRSHEYQEFTGLKRHTKAERVYNASCGIVISPDIPGGVAYEEWLEDPTTVDKLGNEMREHTCPAWWYQSAMSHRQKPYWPEPEWCGQLLGMRFSDCPNFPAKDACWKRFDEEQHL